MKPTRVRTFPKMVSLLLAIIGSMLLVPAAYGQQEIDPTWYDPWAAPRKVAVPPAPPRTTVHKPKRKSRSLSQDRIGKKAHVKKRANPREQS